VFGDAIEGHNQLKLEEYVQAVDLEAVDKEGGRRVAETVFIA